MTTGRKAWLDEWSDNEHQYRTIHIGKCAPDRKGATQGVFLTTAELDTLVAAGEARGAMLHDALRAMLIPEIKTYRAAGGFMVECLRCGKAAKHYSIAWAEAGITHKAGCHIGDAIKAFQATKDDTQAHTQRQRDEGYNEGVEASAEKVGAQTGYDREMDGYAKYFADAILALRKETR